MSDQLGRRSNANNSTWLFFVFFILMLFPAMMSRSFAKDMEYSIADRPDGGYSLSLIYLKRHWTPITAEGIFPTERKSYTVNIIGKGKDWTFRNQKGYYYSLNDISSLQKAWDFGYAWVDADRKYLYLNLYWVSSPEGMTPSDVNGKYLLTK